MDQLNDMVVKIKANLNGDRSNLCFIVSNLSRSQANGVRDLLNLFYIPVVALDALVLLGLLDDDDLVDAALAGGSDGAEVKHLKDNTGIR